MNPVLYIISRNDLGSLNPGKATAQCAHGANAMVSRCNHERPLREIKQDFSLGKLFESWRLQTPQGFGTTIVLAGKMQELVDVSVFLKNYAGAAIHGFTYDPTYPLIVPQEIVPLLDRQMLAEDPVYLDDSRVLLQYNETTNFWALVDKDDPEIQNLFAKFPLHP